MSQCKEAKDFMVLFRHLYTGPAVFRVGLLMYMVFIISSFQFNLGFIVTKLADNLFIIDQVRDRYKHVHTHSNALLFVYFVTAPHVCFVHQHASDEKYNFERLQTDGLIENQKLIQ